MNARHLAIKPATVLGILALCLAPLFSDGGTEEAKKKKRQKPVEAGEVHVVVTASRLPREVGNVTQKIDVVDREELDRVVSANRNVAEALAAKPGAAVSVLSRNDANWGTYSGIGPKYCTYMLQGLPVDAFIEPMSLNLAAIARIEVQRGPASILYPNFLSQDFAGAQSPLAGTVNLILKERVERPLTEISTAYGSYNTLNGRFYHQNRAGGVHLMAGAFYEMSDYADYGSEGSWLNMKDNPEYRKGNLFAGATLFAGRDERHKVTLFVNRTSHLGDAGRLYRGFDHLYTTINAGYHLKLNERLDLQAHLGVRRYDRGWQDSSYDDAARVDRLQSENGAFQNIVPANITLSWGHGRSHLLSIGADVQAADYHTWSDPLLGYRQYGNKATALLAGLFVQEELRFDPLILRGGLRFSHSENNIDFINGGEPGERTMSWDVLLWSLGTRWTIAPQVAAYANAGNSFITPGLKSVGGTIALSDLGVPERHGQLPNPDLRPESGLGLDAGLDLFPRGDLSFNLRGFAIVVDDAIVENVVSENPSQTQSVNAGRSSSLGLEMEVRYAMGRGLSWFANLTWLNTEIENPLDADQDGAAIPFAPEWIANLGFDLATSSGLVVRPHLNVTSGYFDSTSLSGRREFTPGAVVNLFVSQRVVQGEAFTLECFGHFVNLTDNRFEMPWQFQNLGFSFMLGIRVLL